MQHKQNAVVQRCVVGLAGVFSVIGLALFWQQDFAEAQTPVVRERFTQIVTDTQKFTTTEFSQALVAAQNFTDGEISQLLTATQNFTDAEFRQVLDKVRVGRSFNQLLAELQGDATMRVLPNQIWGIDNKKEYLISLTFLKSGDNAMEGGVWKADANATSARGAILATGEVRVGSSNESSAGITAAFF
ncbi:MAG: hypothetical protein LBO09_02025 [Candidatus Peribacteria bacterium]|jgi:hypothetical protein|nr:hypothetical protein [Candidatus Peribacteria bacterium]